MGTPNGLLSASDRQYIETVHPNLHPDEEWEGNETQKRYRLRKKIQQGFRDFNFIRGGLSDDDRRLIFEKGDDEMMRGIEQLLIFLFQGLDEQGRALEPLLADVLVKAQAAPPGKRVDKVDVEVTYRDRDPDVEELRERWETEGRLSREEIGTLVLQGEITPDELQHFEFQEIVDRRMEMESQGAETWDELEEDDVDEGTEDEVQEDVDLDENETDDDGEE